MKTRIFLLFFFVTSYSFSQSINDYKAVIVPVEFDFLKSDNQYRLATVSKYNLNKAGFPAYYDNEPLSDENFDRCNLLNFDVIKERSFLTTKLHVVFKDCFGKIIFQSETGVSKEKDFELAYKEALDKAFVSVYALRYTYTAKDNVNSSPSAKAQAVTEAVAVTVAVVNSDKAVNTEKASSTLLYAQATATGFQLVDSTPRVVMKVYITSTESSFIAEKDGNNGVLISKDGKWFFEYYKNGTLFSEKIDVKF